TLSSRAYIDITLDVMKSFGVYVKNDNYSSFTIQGNQKYTLQSYTVEGDFSQAAFWLVAGALGCDVTCSGLDEKSLQSDKKIIEIIESTGATVERISKNSLKARHSANMKGITIDADDIPDLVPILAVLLCFCKVKSRIENAGRLRIKESDRLAAITAELKKMGADIFEGADYLEIEGKQVLNGAEVSSWNDHRSSMAPALAACRCEGEVTIDGAKKSVKKSYPNFFEDYKALGGEIE
ncbi:MAG: 3-phosphoshikimate 1-carboxyvinyltransferase, partial [Clostridia bacterium]|nr:3-phosphoshikimate 1-carboxyvinyltransferase [Clostridia bacterium]